MTGLIIDSFAGGGGASTGIEMALGRSPDFAINHDPAALAMHAANHPQTVHLTENIWKVDPCSITLGKPVDLLWASPDCRHHSKAKGGAPVSRSVRGLADVVLLWAKVVSPKMICLENVEEFADWGPLGADDKPCPARKGQEFRRWVRTLEDEGYEVEWRELRACNYGAPTIRKRLFLVARRDGQPILWPAPTHGDPASDAVKSGALKPWRTAAEIIDWGIKCPSIFLTKSQAKDEGLKVIRPLAPKTMSRIARGFKRYVLDRPAPFIVSYYGDGTGGKDRSSSLEAPLLTATTENRFGLITPFMSYAQQGGANRPADAPMHTICASLKDQNQVVAPYLATMRNSGKPWTGADEPCHTITAGGAGLSLVAPFLAQHNGGVLGRRADAPAPTMTTAAAQTMPVFGYLAPYIHRQFGASVGSAPDAPVGTITAGGGGKTHVVAPFMTAYYGTGDGAQMDDPLRTATTHDRFGLVDALATIPPFDEAKAASARQVAAFLRAEGAWDGPGEFVTVGPYIVYDIGMRMLAPRELARAQGFPETYILAAPLEGGGTLTDTAQRHKIGNSVCPDVAAAVVRANMIDAMLLPPVRRKRATLPPAYVQPATPRNDLFLEAAE